MRRLISRQAHGVADYAYVPTVALAPPLFGFERERSAVRFCSVMAGAALLYTLLTRSEWGVVRVMPYRLHLAIDLATVPLCLVAPWLMGFEKNRAARKTAPGMALIPVVVGGLSLPAEEMPRQWLPSRWRAHGAAV